MNLGQEYVLCKLQKLEMLLQLNQKEMISLKIWDAKIHSKRVDVRNKIPQIVFILQLGHKELNYVVGISILLRFQNLIFVENREECSNV